MFILKQYKWFLLSGLILLFVPYFILCAFTNPFADDFVYGHRGQSHQVIALAIHEYWNWSGRYTANMLQFLTPLAFNSFNGYKIFPAVLILLQLLSNFFFIHVFTHHVIGVVEKLLLALLFSLLFLHQMPILSEGIYWYAGSVVYQLGNSCFILYISLLYQYTQQKLVFKSKLTHLVLITLLLVVCIGFNEVITLALLLFSVISLFIVYKNKLQNRWLFFYLFGITLVCAGVTFLAPGNAARASLFEGNHRFFYSIFMGAAQTIRFFLKWMSSIPLLLTSFLYYYFNRILSQHIPLFSKSFYLKPLYSIGILFCLIFIAAFPPYWATGILGQHRTLNVACYLFLIAWFINLTVFFNWKTECLMKQITGKTCLILICIIFIAFVFTKNGYNVTNDLFSGRAGSYNRQMQGRYALFQTSSDTIYFEAIKDPPKSLFLYDVSEEPQYWMNIAYTLYFNCKEKRIIRKTEPIN